MTLDKQVLAKLAFEPGDKRKLDEIWLTVEKTVKAKRQRTGQTLSSLIVARTAFQSAYMKHGIKGPLATTALAAVGL